MKRFFFLPVAALLLSATCLTPAFADSYGSDNAAANSTTSTSATSANASSAYDDVSPSSGRGLYDYDWNPFTANEGVYLSGQVGYNFPTDNDLDDDASYAGAIGYQFSPMIRAELEGTYRNNEVDGSSADVDTYTAMINMFWDFKNDTAFTPYLGGGIGWAWSEINAGGGDADDNAFVYQLGGGASYNLTQNWALTADYRFIDTAEFDYGAGEDDYTAHELRAGVRYTF